MAMDERRFDRLSRTLARTGTRRTLAAAAFGGFAAFVARRAGAAQLVPATCAAQGQVCTLLYGCCEGLTCATSMINPSYGVCAPGGSGGMVAVSTQLVVPSNGSATTDTSTTTTTTTTTPTLPDPTATSTTSTTTSTTDAEKEARQAERDARKADRKARQQDHRDDQQFRRDQQQDRRQDRRATQQLNQAPNLSLEYVGPSGTDTAEAVVVTNNDDDSVFLSSIRSRTNGRISTSLSFSLGSGEYIVLLSNLANDTPVDNDEYLWYDQPVCTASEVEDGFVVRAGKSSSSENHDFEVLCDGTTLSPDVSGTGSGSGRNRRRRKARKSAGRDKKSKNKK
jgi:hypothetical protein